MDEHPIEGLMLTAMNSIQDMVDVNTIIGEPIEAKNGTLIVPISKVSFGFAAGGSEFKGGVVEEYSKKDKNEEISYRNPFGGGSGAGVNISPIGFLCVGSDVNNGIRFIPVEHDCAVDKLLDYIPDIIEKASKMFEKKQEKKEENKDESNIKTVANAKTKPKKTNIKTNLTYEYDYNKPNTHIDDEQYEEKEDE